MSRSRTARSQGYTTVTELDMLRWELNDTARIAEIRRAAEACLDLPSSPAARGRALDEAVIVLAGDVPATPDEPLRLGVDASTMLDLDVKLACTGATWRWAAEDLDLVCGMSEESYALAVDLLESVDCVQSRHEFLSVLAAVVDAGAPRWVLQGLRDARAGRLSADEALQLAGHAWTPGQVDRSDDTAGFLAEAREVPAYLAVVRQFADADIDVSLLYELKLRAERTGRRFDVAFTLAAHALWQQDRDLLEATLRYVHFEPTAAGLQEVVVGEFARFGVPAWYFELADEYRQADPEEDRMYAQSRSLAEEVHNLRLDLIDPDPDGPGRLEIAQRIESASRAAEDLHRAAAGRRCRMNAASARRHWKQDGERLTALRDAAVNGVYGGAALDELGALQWPAYVRPMAMPAPAGRGRQPEPPGR